MTWQIFKDISDLMHKICINDTENTKNFHKHHIHNIATEKTDAIIVHIETCFPTKIQNYNHIYAEDTIYKLTYR